MTIGALESALDLMFQLALERKCSLDLMILLRGASNCILGSAGCALRLRDRIQHIGRHEEACTSWNKTGLPSGPVPMLRLIVGYTF